MTNQPLVINKQTAGTMLAIILSIVSVLGAYGVITPAQTQITQTLIQQLMKDMNLTYAQVSDALSIEVGSSLSSLASPCSYMISHPLGDNSITAMKNGTTGAWNYWSSNASKVFNYAVGNLSTGGKIFEQNGTYLLDTAITVVAGTSNLVFEGESWSAVLTQTYPFNGVLGVINCEGSAGVASGGVEVRNLKIVGSGLTSTVTGVRMSYFNSSGVDNVYMQDLGYAGFSGRYSVGQYVQNSYFYRNGYNPAAGGVQVYMLNNNYSKITDNWVWGAVNTVGGIELDYNTINGYDNTVSNNIVYGNDGYGIRVKNNQCTISGNDISQDYCNGTGNLMEMSILGNNTLVSGNWIHCNVAGVYVIDTGTTTDYSQFIGNHVWGGTYGLRIGGGADDCLVSNFYDYQSLGLGIIVSGNRADINNAYIYNATTYGIEGYTVQDLDLIDDYVYSAGGYGVAVFAGCVRFNMEGCTINGGANHGIYLSGACSNVRIVNNIIENQTGVGKYAIYFADSLSVNGTLENNYLVNNTGAIYNGFLWNATTITMCNNFGYNPVQYIASPIYGAQGNANNTIVDSGTNSTTWWASGTTYTNWGSPKTIYVTGGTVTVIAVDGQTLFTSATTISIVLQPGETFSVTFSVIPTIKIFGQ